ncbi:hypothetical protein GSI_10142 [Ganoderma sinense ZZ0214-1]|uniref:F-box domain-containing protein n=1 Tax=Ganoderma sinense ZZ0214-1 TaxID=1077348 RepID=A0A2G8RZQ4_9APHY|nr:hypothetical protein GSI_10142 [Ganoderma sinense ZZ0214-1]
MQDGPRKSGESTSDLLHLGDLSLSQDAMFCQQHILDAVGRADQRFLAGEDSVALSQLGPGEVQEWCLSRITEYHNQNRLLRERYGAVARNAISKNKSHIRAIRTAYNDAAPIHRYFPPEVLIEVFSHVHPATLMPRPRVPVLGVCRYWRRLLLHTPRFWANLLSLPSWKSWNTKYHDHVGRFGAAMALSAPQRLTISIPYCFAFIADILASHAARLSSLRVGRTLYDVASVAQVLEQDMPLLTHLAILYQPCFGKVPTFTLNLSSYPKLRILEFEGAHFYTPGAPCTSLRHLKLKHCTIQPPPSDSTLRSLCAVHNALRLFPNLETLSLVHSLSEDDPYGYLRPLPELTETIHLPCLRHLELEDIPPSISLFLSHLMFPSTTALVLEPTDILPWSRRPLSSPFFPGINPSPSDPSAERNAELNLCLYLRGARDDEKVARWETRGDGVRPMRVTLSTRSSAYLRHNDDDTVALVTYFSREIVAVLFPRPVPATALGVTSLTVQRFTYFPRSAWEQLLRELPALRRLECASGGTADTLVKILGNHSEPPDEGTGFLCTRLAELALGWYIPYCTSELGQPEDRGEWEGLLPLQDNNSAERVDSESPLAAALLSHFCETLRRCLAARAGHCEPIRKLSVSLPREHDYPMSGVVEEWQVTLVEQRLRCALGHLVPEIVVAAEVS